MAKTYTERLELVRTAIDEILSTGQSVSVDGRNFSMADLSELRKLELDYETRAARETATRKGRNRLIYVKPVT